MSQVTQELVHTSFLFTGNLINVELSMSNVEPSKS